MAATGHKPSFENEIRGQLTVESALVRRSRGVEEVVRLVLANYADSSTAVGADNDARHVAPEPAEAGDAIRLSVDNSGWLTVRNRR